MQRNRFQQQKNVLYLLTKLNAVGIPLGFFSSGEIQIWKIINSPDTVAAIHAWTVRIHCLSGHHFMGATCRRIFGRIDIGQTTAGRITVLQPHGVAAVVRFDFGICLRIGQIAILHFVHRHPIGHSGEKLRANLIIGIPNNLCCDLPLLEDIQIGTRFRQTVRTVGKAFTNRLTELSGCWSGQRETSVLRVWWNFHLQIGSACLRATRHFQFIRSWHSWYVGRATAIRANQHRLTFVRGQGSVGRFHVPEWFGRWFRMRLLRRWTPWTVCRIFFFASSAWAERTLWGEINTVLNRFVVIVGRKFCESFTWWSSKVLCDADNFVHCSCPLPLDMCCGGNIRLWGGRLPLFISIVCCMPSKLSPRLL